MISSSRGILLSQSGLGSSRSSLPTLRVIAFRGAVSVESDGTESMLLAFQVVHRDCWLHRIELAGFKGPQTALPHSAD